MFSGNGCSLTDASVQLGLGEVGPELSEQRLAEIAGQARVFRPGDFVPGYRHACMGNRVSIRQRGLLIATTTSSQMAPATPTLWPRDRSVVEVCGGRRLRLFAR